MADNEETQSAGTFVLTASQWRKPGPDGRRGKLFRRGDKVELDDEQVDRMVNRRNPLAVTESEWKKLQGQSDDDDSSDESVDEGGNVVSTDEGREVNEQAGNADSAVRPGGTRGPAKAKR